MAKKTQTKAHELSEDTIAAIRASLVGYRPGLWARLVNYGPACTCGLRSAKGECFRHNG